MNSRAPLWLAKPSRYARLPSFRARWMLASLAVLLLASLATSTMPAPEAAGSAHAMLSEAVVEGVRHGGDYYVVAADALRASGDSARPFVTIPLPTLAVVQAHLSPVAAALLLYALAVGTLFAWYIRLAGVFRSASSYLIGVALAAGGMIAAMRPELVASGAVWAGLLIALSLAARRPGRWQSGAALGLAAMLIDETAVMYVAIMTAIALLEGNRREAAGWVAAAGVFALALLYHAQAVAAVVGPIVASPHEIAIDLDFAVRALIGGNVLSLAPPALAGLLAGFAIFGWSAWRDPLGPRALALLGTYALLTALLGTSDPAFLIAPLVPIGLAFAVDGLRDLVRASLDRRRITVTRTAR